jgi:multidrug efflux pump subunit AcrB
MLQFAIPEVVDQATANLLMMQMTMMQNMMAQMEGNYQANQFQLEKRLDNERREQQDLAEQLKNRDNNGQKVVGKAPKFDLDKDRENFKTWKL